MAFGHTHQYFVRGSRSMVYEEYVDKIHILKKHQGMFDLVSTELYVSTAINDNKIVELMYWPLAADIFTQYSPTQILLGPSIISQQGCHYVQALARLALRLAGASWALNAPEDYRNRAFGPATGGRIVERCDLDEWTHSRMSGIVRILESLHTIFVWIYLYRLTVTFYGIPAALGEIHWSLETSSLFDGIIGAAVQMFFAYRIRMISTSWPVTLVSWAGSLLQLVFSVVITVVSPSVSVAEFTIKYGWVVQALLIVNLVVDIINTSALTFYLNRGRTGFKGNDLIIEKLTTWTIETGALTASLDWDLAFLRKIVFQLVFGDIEPLAPSFVKVYPPTFRQILAYEPGMPAVPLAFMSASSRLNQTLIWSWARLARGTVTKSAATFECKMGAFRYYRGI
ncbi:hypothetical protein C8J57DRAFT_1479939 [Mycena rebaudengoi]|nr:hypothetical protein C8J57DRAFT_1479939 [Mycena rebaudengoi]